MVYTSLMYIIKRRDPEGLIYVVDALVDCTTEDEFTNIMTSFFIANAENITPDDIEFFEITSNAFITQATTKNKPKPIEKKEKKNIEDVDMRKITKAVALFEKNGLELGKDYSFHNGKIRMKKECQEKITKLLGN